MNLTTQRASGILAKAEGLTLAVVGDVMLDRFFWGSVSRISPEAPVPVVDIESETYLLGGAANVANNLKSLCVEPLLCSIIGRDKSGEIFLDTAIKAGIKTDAIYSDANRPTTVKTRIIGNNQHIARLDRENREPISYEAGAYIFDAIIGCGNLSGIILEDYNKGMLTHGLITGIIEYARKKDIPVFVDPKFENFFSYQYSTIFKPNKKELAQALGISLKTHGELLDAGRLLLDKLKCRYGLITLGADGMMLFDSDGTHYMVPTNARQVADVTGAGDTAIAVLSAAYSGGAEALEAALLGNFAAGIVCEKTGIVAVTKDEIIESVNLYGKTV